MIAAATIAAFGSFHEGDRHGRVALLFGAASAEAETRSREESERRPGRLFTLHNDPMGLDNLPVPCTCGKHTYDQRIPKGLTHREEDPCPFKDDRFPIGIVGRCCWLRGKAAAEELKALGEHDLYLIMHEEMTAEDALSFARTLDNAADSLVRKYRHQADKPKGAPWNGTWDPEQGAWVYETNSTFEEAIASIRESARWFEKVGRLGFGVFPWY
jgi:hypothetical protein